MSLFTPSTCKLSSRWLRCIPFLVASTCTLAADDLGVRHQGLVEVVVTARKRAENLYEVPIAITSFESQQLDSPALENLSNLSGLAPNLDVNWTSPFSGSSNAASVFIRGIGQNDFLLTTDPGVGVYLDGVYIARSIGGVLDLGDVERVEVLRGPQGTLFGKNTLGGAIQVLTRNPSDVFQATLSATTGSDRRRDMSVSVEGSLAAAVQARLSVASQARDGYATRVLDGIELGDIDRQMVRMVMTGQPDAVSEWKLSIDHTKQRQEAVAQTVVEVADSTLLKDLYNLLVAPPDMPFDSRWVSSDPLRNYQTGPSQDDLDITGVGLSFERDMNWAQVTSTTGFRQYTATYGRDPDGSPLPYAHSVNADDHRQISQEIRLSGQALNTRLDWLAGVYLMREHGKNHTDAVLLSGLYEATANPALELVFDVNNDQIARSGAVFSQVSYQLTDPLSLTAGVRLTRETKKFSVDNSLVVSQTQVVGPVSETESWSDISPMLSLDYQWHETLMTYASVSRGFKSGGFDGRQIIPGPLDSFDPEYAQTYELGLKSQLWDRRLSVLTSVFYSAYKDLQFTQLEAGGIPHINNAAEARIQGAELELAWQSNGFLMKTGTGYLDAEYRSLDEGVTIAEGNKLVRVPRWNAYLMGTYEWELDALDLGDIGGLKFNADLTYKSKVYHDPANVESIAQSGVSLINTNLEWSSPDDSLSVQVFVTNLAGKRVIVSGATELAGLGYSEVNYARGREWGLNVIYRFL